jgi:hypothetical protein
MMGHYIQTNGREAHWREVYSVVFRRSSVEPSMDYDWRLLKKDSVPWSLIASLPRSKVHLSLPNVLVNRNT